MARTLRHPGWDLQPRRRVLAAAAVLLVGVYSVVAYRNDLPPFRLDAGFEGSSGTRSEAPRRRGRWGAAPDSAAASLTPAQREAMERLRSVGYLSGHDPAPGRVGVTRYEPDSVGAGLNLAVSGHAPEAWLFDAGGRVLHRWARTFAEAFPGAAVPGDTETPYYWRKAVCLPDGSLLAVFEGLGLVKLDRESRIVWTLKEPVHHDVFVGEEGSLATLVRETRILPRIHPREPVLEDFVVVLDSHGTPLRRVSLLEAFERSSYRSLLERMPEAGDLFHTNSIEILDGSAARRFPAFRRGRALVSMLTLDAIAVVDLVEQEVVWAATGSWRAQHDPTLLESGRILLFDNRGGPGEGSRILEIDPSSGRETWGYGGTPETAFRTYDCGAVARLPGGNTLITESNRGRTFEITPSGRTVWEYYNPHRAGDRRQMIATLFEVVRIPPGYFEGGFEPPGGGGGS